MARDVHILIKIPAFAGMTEGGAGMTEGGAGMTEGGAGMTERGAGMTERGAGMAEGGNSSPVNVNLRIGTQAG